jgi:hypothetical protein
MIHNILLFDPHQLFTYQLPILCTNMLLEIGGFTFIFILSVFVG